MTDTITLTGLVATEPNHTITSAGLNITSFRLASTQRRFDRTQNKWVDGDTNWYTISAFRQLAVNASTSIRKGERIVVTGRLRLREWQTAEKSGMTIDIEADAIGHDLSWGTARWARTSQASAGGSERQEQRTDAPDGSEQSTGDGNADGIQWAGSGQFSGALGSGASTSSSFEDAAASTSDASEASVLAGGGDDTPF